jgi:tetratricopeptide (TPR) repeat protein
MPDVEVQAPEIDDIDEKATPFKRMVALLVVSITLLASVIAYLQTVESHKEERAAREAQRFAVSGLGSQVDASADFQRAFSVFTQSELLDQQRILAARRQRQSLGTPRSDLYALDQARATAVKDALIDASPLLGESDFSERNDPNFPFAFQAEVNVGPDEARLRQEAQAELADGHGSKADTYVAILTVLAVSLFLLGLSLTVEGRSRRLLVVPGVTIAAICVAWAALTALRDVPRTSERALRSVAEGNRLLAQSDADGAVEAYTRAIDERSDYGTAFGLRADAQFIAGSNQQTGFVSITDAEHLALAIDDNERAMELGADDDLGVVASLGFHYFLAEEFGKAARLTDDALDINDRLAPLWFNAAVIEVARGDGDLADEYYDIGLDIVRAEPDQFVRSDILSAARVDLGIARELSDDADDLADAMEAKLAAAELELVSLGEGEAALDAAGDPEIVQNGIFLQLSMPAEELQEGDPVAAIWYFRPEGDQPFSQPAGMNRFFSFTDPNGTGSLFTSSLNGLCTVAGEYRVEVFREDELLASASIEVPPGLLGEQVDDRSELLSTEVCIPADWTAEEDLEAGTFFMSNEDASESMTVGVVGVGTGGGDALLRQTIIDAAAGFGEVDGAPFDQRIGNLDGQTVFATDASGVRSSVSAAVDERGVLRVVFASGPDAETLDAIHTELFPGIFFSDLDV